MEYQHQNPQNEVEPQDQLEEQLSDSRSTLSQEYNDTLRQARASGLEVEVNHPTSQEVQEARRAATRPVVGALAVSSIAGMLSAAAEAMPEGSHTKHVAESAAGVALAASLGLMTRGLRKGARAKQPQTTINITAGRPR